MTAFLAWVLLAAVVTVIACGTDDPRSLVVMFAVSLLLPEEAFTEEI